jgi:hypothetical protein
MHISSNLRMKICHSTYTLYISLLQILLKGYNFHLLWSNQNKQGAIKHVHLY